MYEMFSDKKILYGGAQQMWIPQSKPIVVQMYNTETNMHYFGCYCKLYLVVNESMAIIKQEKEELEKSKAQLKELEDKMKTDQEVLNWNFDLKLKKTV